MKHVLYIIIVLNFSFCIAQNQVDPTTLALAGGEQVSVFTDINLNQVVLLDLESVSGNLDLDFSFLAENIEAGEAVIPAGGSSNNDLWLNYTSAVVSGETRNIGVNIDTSLPPGVDLSVTAASYSGSGEGIHGIPALNPIALNTTNQDILTGIGGAYTGDGALNGHNLNYVLNVSDPSAIPSGGLDIQVTYTLSASL